MKYLEFAAGALSAICLILAALYAYHNEFILSLAFCAMSVILAYIYKEI